MFFLDQFVNNTISNIVCEKQALAQLIANSTKAGDKTPQLSPYILDLQKTITKNKEV